jgi:hypothetical protein
MGNVAHVAGLAVHLTAVRPTKIAQNSTMVALAALQKAVKRELKS